MNCNSPIAPSWIRRMVSTTGASAADQGDSDLVATGNVRTTSDTHTTGYGCAGRRCRTSHKVTTIRFPADRHDHAPSVI